MIDQTIKNSCLEESKCYCLSKTSDRIKQLGEVFTPTEIVLDILSQLPPDAWVDGKTFLDPTCGNGQFLSAVLLVKKSLGHINLLNTIYGVDLMDDNVQECRHRLLAIVGDTEENRYIVERNLICENGLKYDYSFGKNVFDSLFG